MSATSVCPEETLTAVATPGNLASYQWTVNTVPDTVQTGSIYTYQDIKSQTEQILFEVRAESNEGCVSDPVQTTVVIKTIPTIALTPQPVFCVEEYGTRIRWRDLVTAGTHTVKWYADENAQTPILPQDIDQSLPGTHTLYATAVSTNGCVSDVVPMPVTVTVNENPVLDRIDTASLTNIEIMITGGTRPYNWDINGMSGKTERIIEVGFLPLGRHRLLVIDKNGCVLDALIPILKAQLIPDQYFTPNGEGNIETEIWTIKNLDYYLEDGVTIHIFDRTGKELLRQSAHEFNGWDGRFNGKNMPSTDYWYLITIDKLGERLTGNFTLKR